MADLSEQEEFELLTLEREKSQFGSTPGGAAVGNPNVQRKYRGLGTDNSMLETAGEIAGAGAIGAGAGAVARELLKGGGQVVQPMFPAVGAAMQTMGRIAEMTPRGVSATAGGFSGLASESIGKASEAMGAGPVAAEAARVAGGLIPEFTGLARLAVKGAIDLVGGSGTAAGLKALLKAAVTKMGVKTEDLSEQQRKYIEGLILDARGAPKSDTPMQAVYGGLESEAGRLESEAAKNAWREIGQGEFDAGMRGGQLRSTGRAEADASLSQARTQAGERAESMRRIGRAEADSILSTGETQAKQVINDAMKGPRSQEAMGAVSKRLQDIAASSLDAAKRTRMNIGADAEISDIGGSLRGIVVPRHQAALTERASAYKTLETARDEAVQALEASGKRVEQLPEFKTLMADLSSKLLNTKAARDKAGDLAPVTETGVLNSYNRIFDAVRNRRVQTGVNEEGNATFQTFKTSFDALDDVRRKLGEVYAGRPPEGYDGLSADIARKYYAQISDIQKRFVGGEAIEDNIQSQLLRSYADKTLGLEKFGTKGGRKLTAVDRFNEGEFSANPASVPKYFFSSQQGVKDLVELTGDRGVVIQSAKDFATNELRNLDAQGVRKWLGSQKNSDWLKQLPEVSKVVDDYATTLERAERQASNMKVNSDRALKLGERTAKEAQALGGKLRTDADRAASSRLDQINKEWIAQNESTIAAAEKAVGKTISQADKLALAAESEIRGAAATTAKGIIADARKQADDLVRDKFPVPRVRALVEGGSPKEWSAVAPAIKRSPEARDNIFDAVRQVIADRAERSPKGINQFFEENVRPAIVNSGLVTKKQADLLARKLDMIDAMAIPEVERFGWKQRILLQSIDGYASSALARTPAYIDRKLNAPPPP